MAGRIRLGCIHCDRTDCDFVDALPDDWSDLREVQSFEAAIEAVPVGSMPGRSRLDWETHLGVCPDCLSIEGDKTADDAES